MKKLGEVDQKWIDALHPYWGSGTVPTYTHPDGSVDAQHTIDRMMGSRGQCKIEPNGEALPLGS